VNTALQSKPKTGKEAAYVPYAHISYAMRYYTSDIMIHGMAPIPKEKAMI